MATKICLSKELRRGSGLWKFNNSLLQDENFVKELKKYIKEFKTQDTQNFVDEQLKWDFLKSQELDEIFDDITEGLRIRSRCQWYEKGENSNKFFLNLGKKAWNPRSYTKTYSKR